MTGLLTLLIIVAIIYLFARLICRKLWQVIFLGVVIILLSWILVPSLQRANRAARAKDCMKNLKQLSFAMHMYAQDNNKKFPDDLIRLYPKYVSAVNIFFCPSTPGVTLPKKIKTHEDANLSYSLTPGLSENDDPNIVLVRDKSAWNHKSVMHRLFIDGHGEQIYVTKILEQDFDTISAALHEFWKAKGRYPTNEEGLEILVRSGYLRVILVDPFDPEGRRSYGYACNVSNKWIITSYGPDKKQNIDLKLYTQGKYTNQDLMKMQAQLIFGMMTIKRTSGDVFRVEP